MGEVTVEQVTQLLTLISEAQASHEAVQKVLIERFDLIQILMRHPEIVQTIDPVLFESFILSMADSLGLSSSTPWASVGEETVTTFGYPAGWQLKPVSEQLTVLCASLPSLESALDVPASLPEGAEGWLVMPKPGSIAKSYNEALERLLSINNSGKTRFVNIREGKLGREFLRLTERTEQVIAESERGTPGDFMVLAVQSGARHQARSVMQVRESFIETEYGLGPFEVASLLVTHPERLTGYTDLGIDCPGCTYALTANGEPGFSLYFTWSEEGILLDSSAIDGVGPGFGSASGFKL